jgi:hypothetical protein
LPKSVCLSGAAAFRKDRAFESDFLNGFHAGTVVLLASQQTFPAMGQAQPKFPIVFIAGIGGQLSALLDLVLEEIGCFKHSITQTKRPAHRGFYASHNAAAPNQFRQSNNARAEGHLRLYCRLYINIARPVVAISGRSRPRTGLSTDGPSVQYG